jgi:hypothetical protein
LEKSKQMATNAPEHHKNYKFLQKNVRSIDMSNQMQNEHKSQQISQQMATYASEHQQRVKIHHENITLN